MHRDSPGRAEPEQQHLSPGDVPKPCARAVDHRCHHQHDDRAEVLHGGSAGRQRETLAGVHHRGGGSDHAIEKDLRDKHDDEQSPDPRLGRPHQRGHTAECGQPQHQGAQGDGHRSNQHQCQQGHA
jgi:hypothetical protein